MVESRLADNYISIRRNIMPQTKHAPLVGIVMGSDSDWDIMQHAVEQLADFGVAHEARVLSAHRMPDRSEEHTSELQSRENLVCRLLLEKKKKRLRTLLLYKKKKKKNKNQ